MKLQYFDGDRTLTLCFITGSNFKKNNEYPSRLLLIFEYKETFNHTRGQTHWKDNSELTKNTAHKDDLIPN